MLLIKTGGNKCASCEIEQLGHEGKLDVSVCSDRDEALESPRIEAESFQFGGLEMQDRPDVYSVITIF